MLPRRLARTIHYLFPFATRFCSIQNTYPAAPIRVKSLAALIREQKNVNIRDLIESNNQNLFKYGIHPIEFRLHLLVYFKYGYWQTHQSARERLLNFITHCNEQENIINTVGDNGEAGRKELELINNYRREISCEILPQSIVDQDFSNVYLDQLSKFLQGKGEVGMKEINQILFNLQRIIFKPYSIHFNNEKDNGWSISHVFSQLLDRCMPHLSSLSSKNKDIIVAIGKSLRVKHLYFLEWLKRDLQKERKDLSLQGFLSALLYLGYYNSFPYEFFYSDKSSLMSFIEAADKLSDKIVAISINLLEIFARHRLAYCEKVVNRLLICIRENLTASDVTQLARIFFYYSRLKCAIDHDFVASIIQRLYLFLNTLDSQHYLLIIKAVASLDYRDDVLLEKLKDYDYELFLTSLKFGCSSLGEYYRAVLDQVEQSFAKDPERYYKQEDEPFIDVVVGNRPLPAQ